MRNHRDQAICMWDGAYMKFSEDHLVDHVGLSKRLGKQKSKFRNFKDTVVSILMQTSKHLQV